MGQPPRKTEGVFVVEGKLPKPPNNQVSVHAPSHLIDYSYQIEMELVYMSQAIVPLSQSKSRRLEKSSKSGLLFKCRIGSQELSVYSALPTDQVNLILDRIFAHGSSTQ